MAKRDGTATASAALCDACGDQLLVSYLRETCLGDIEAAGDAARGTRIRASGCERRRGRLHRRLTTPGDLRGRRTPAVRRVALRCHPSAVDRASSTRKRQPTLCVTNRRGPVFGTAAGSARSSHQRTDRRAPPARTGAAGEGRRDPGVCLAYRDRGEATTRSSSTEHGPACGIHPLARPIAQPRRQSQIHTFKNCSQKVPPSSNLRYNTVA